MNGTDELDLLPADFSFLRSVGIKMPWYCRRHPAIELPPSRHPRKGKMRHYTGCCLCKREDRRVKWQKFQRNQMHLF
jgi:hypothetical protein